MTDVVVTTVVAVMQVGITTAECLRSLFCIYYTQATSSPGFKGKSNLRNMREDVTMPVAVTTDVAIANFVT